jgi:predicted N-acetyltransferase YhbS
LNDWLARRARAAEGATARTYVIAEGRRILGYCCLSSGAVERAAWPGSFRRNAPDPLPIILLGRLAVDRAHQGSGLARVLMLHAMRQSLAASRLVGSQALVVHALSDEVMKFYAQLGFKPLASLPLTLFMSFETIAETLISLERSLH